MSDYFEDEFYDDEYERWNPCDEVEWSTWVELHKGHNGHLILFECSLGRCFGEDWGEASLFESGFHNLSLIREPYRSLLIELGKTIEPRSSVRISWDALIEEADDEEPSDSLEIPF
ncbi:MAG: hypothetical protein KJ065_26910 [Anaerolineae bacterium]|nr:hypothetical protein [Anaerolineae bacterium]